MLKIKDNIPLKQLERFGFERIKNERLDQYEWDCGDNRSYITIGIDHQISLISGLYGDVPEYDFDKNQLDIIYDLIKADMVEKVEN